MPRPHGRPIKGKYPFRPIPGMTHTPLPPDLFSQPKPKKATKGLGARLSAYGDSILAATQGMHPPAQPEDTHQIEEAMRTQHSTLDSLDRTTLDELAQAAWLAVQGLRQEGVLETPKGEK